jgi:hypothetical protein
MIVAEDSLALLCGDSFFSSDQPQTLNLVCAPLCNERSTLHFRVRGGWRFATTINIYFMPAVWWIKGTWVLVYQLLFLLTAR